MGRDGMGVVGYMGYELCGMGCCWVAGWSSDGGVVIMGLVFGVWCGLWVLVGMWCGGRYGGGGVEERNIW